MIAIPKPNKPLDDARSYRPISLLCVPYKILEQLIYSRVESIIDPHLPPEQSGFRRGRSTLEQVTRMSQDIEDCFEDKKKAGAVFIDLTAAYDTVWYRGLACKLLQLLPNRHMVRMMMELIYNRSFTLNNGRGKKAGCDDSKTTFFRVLFWLHSFSTFTSMTSHQQLLSYMPMPMIWPWCTRLLNGPHWKRLLTPGRGNNIIIAPKLEIKIQQV